MPGMPSRDRSLFRVAFPRLVVVVAIAAVILLTDVRGAWAHIGSGDGGAMEGALHPVSGWDHALAMVAVGVIAAAIRGRRRWLAPVAFLAGMVVGGLLGMFGDLHLGIETAIAASVVLLGLAAAIPAYDRGSGFPADFARAPGPLGLLLVVLVGASGAVHGYAHGSEMPLGSSPLPYALAFVLTTSALHVLGALSGTLLARYRVGRPLLGLVIATAGAAFLVS